MPELAPNKEYFAAVDKDNQVVGGVYQTEEYAQQVLEAAFSRDNPHIHFHDDIDITRQTAMAGYRVKKVVVTVEE